MNKNKRLSEHGAQPPIAPRVSLGGLSKVYWSSHTSFSLAWLCPLSILVLRLSMIQNS